jgi:hypothetical protein
MTMRARRIWVVAIVAATVSCFAMAGEPLSASPIAPRAVPHGSAPAAYRLAADPARAESTLRAAARELPIEAVQVAPLAAMPARVEHTAPAPVLPVAQPTVSAGSGSTPTGYGCAAAIAYLQAHAEPSFTIECPAYAAGGQAMTCDHHAPQCPNSRVIAILVPCPAAYMNEAHNSWVFVGKASGIDPYGWCH